LSTEAGDDIWVKQLPRGPLSRVSYEAAPEFRPRWTPDGQSVTFISVRPGGNGMYRRRADASGADSLIIAGPFDEAMYSPNGDWLLFRQGAGGAMAGGREIRGMRVGRDTTPVPVLSSRFDEEAPAVSADGKWMAYQSDETGRTEVFIRSFPNVEQFKRQLSNGGGVAPLWSRDGRELFFLAGGRQMMSVRVTSGATPTISEPVSLFSVADELLKVESFYYTPWDVAADGRFIMARLQRDPGEGAPVAVVAENWLTELKRRMR
jgi:serine/threonine-protein kinase